MASIANQPALLLGESYSVEKCIHELNPWNPFPAISNVKKSREISEK